MGETGIVIELAGEETGIFTAPLVNVVANGPWPVKLIVIFWAVNKKTHSQMSRKGNQNFYKFS